MASTESEPESKGAAAARDSVVQEQGAAPEDQVVPVPDAAASPLQPDLLAPDTPISGLPAESSEEEPAQGGDGPEIYNEPLPKRAQRGQARWHSK